MSEKNENDDSAVISMCSCGEAVRVPAHRLTDQPKPPVHVNTNKVECS